MMRVIHQIWGSQFLRQNAIFVVGSGLVSFMNYLYYPVLGRLLTPADFGEVQAIISFFLQTSVFLSVLSLVTIGVVKRYEDPAERAAVLGELERLAWGIGLGGFIVVVALSPMLQDFLNFNSLVPFLLLALSVLLGIPASFSNAYIQAHRRFGWLSGANLLGAASKLVFSVALVLVGLRAAGAVGGVVLSQALSMLVALALAWRLGRRLPPLTIARPNLTLVRPELRYAGLVLVTSLAINILLSSDIIVAKHVFDPHEAGLYAGIATVARIIFFLTGPLAAVLIASVKLDDPAHNRALLLRSGVLLTGLGGTALAAFALWPAQIVGLLIGTEYQVYANILPLLALALFILSLANLLTYYYVALRRPGVMVAALVATPIAIGIMALHHATPADLVMSLLISSVILTTLMVGINQFWRPRYAK